MVYFNKNGMKTMRKEEMKKNNIESKITIISRLITEIQIRAGERV